MSDKQMRGKPRHSYEEDEPEEELRPKKKSKKSDKKARIKKKKRIILRIFLILILLIVIAAGVAFGYINNMLNQMDRTDIDKNEIEINEGVETTGYFNILLFGVDARDLDNSYDQSLSDTIMVVSINQDTKKVKIASIYRDTYLQFTGKSSFDKITHAFAEGGPSLSMSTINTNLDLDITDYVAVDFAVVADVVDAVGGVTITLTNEEARLINSYIEEMNNCTNRHSEYITKGGTYEMDGIQATAYARIRYTEGGDWKRTERQREVIDLVFEKIKTMNVGKLSNIASTILKKVSTNVSNAQILYLLSQAASYEIEDTTGWPYEVVDYQPAKVWYGVPRKLRIRSNAVTRVLV